jgi:hypothetical protein
MSLSQMMGHTILAAAGLPISLSFVRENDIKVNFHYAETYSAKTGFFKIFSLLPNV